MDVITGGKCALAPGFGDMGKGYAFALHGAGARVLIAENKPISALQACQGGLRVVTMEPVA
eukprot:12967917-Heterocapsa_arctica.AAC.1